MNIYNLRNLLNDLQRLHLDLVNALNQPEAATMADVLRAQEQLCLALGAIADHIRRREEDLVCQITGTVY